MPSAANFANPSQPLPAAAGVSTVAYLGPSGTYAEAAAQDFCAQAQIETGSLRPYPTIAATVEAVANGSVEWGVVPVENSIEGGVAMTLDSLWRLGTLQIHQAIVLPIRHCLIGTAAEWDPQQITEVLSHPQALGQCQTWLRTHLPQAIPVSTSSTAGALEQLIDQPHRVAIASRRAAQLYQLPILAAPINDHPDNSTRFWAISQTPSPTGSHTSLAFSLPDNVPGALLRPLQILATEGLNMSRIESRPTKKSAGTYVFFIDIEHPHLPHLPPDVLQALGSIADKLQLLGSYDVLPQSEEI
ncbi:MAG: prephenate dehydratase [Synechococcaceae cyanobacterium SM2_3_2]|nr:prephenate dehydratase [Synechococcaceae cyanobacterium SM2_3_2]